MSKTPTDGFDRRSLLTGSWQTPPKGPVPVRPPGALDAERFDALCDGCGECAAVCPAQAIVMTGPANKLAEHTPEIIAVDAPCVMCDGMVCAPACPTGALVPVTPGAMGIASIEFSPSACWSAQGMDPDCDYCFDRCPIKGEAITHRRGSGPTIHAEHCTGCGVCVHYCPSSPKALVATAA